MKIELAIFALTYIRPSWSRILNFVYSDHRSKLPVCRTLEEAEEVADEIEWTADRHIDWAKDPELTYGEGKGDCDDISPLVAELIKVISPERQLIDFMCLPLKISHEICKFNGGYFDNGRLIYTDKTVEEIGERWGNALKAIVERNPDTGRVRRIK